MGYSAHLHHFNETSGHIIGYSHVIGRTIYVPLFPLARHDQDDVGSIVVNIGIGVVVVVRVEVLENEHLQIRRSHNLS